MAIAFLRWLLMITFIYTGWQSYKKKKEKLEVVLIFFGAVAINVLIRFKWDKETWHLIDYTIYYYYNTNNS